MIVGTAGHIDHGKTALVRALTGVDTDRLPEEQRRGITIELGFAPLELAPIGLVGIVDVPGHEAFVRTMVAGASGIDVALLVVAADDGIKPQTREHIDVLDLLGVEHAVVAITKADLVDDDAIAAVARDVAVALSATSLAGAPCVAVSALSGRGIAELKALLATTLRETRRLRSDDLARMPVDRVFTKSGAGTVVTGTLWSGTLSVGESIRLMPGEREARIRDVQTHGRSVPGAYAGARVALALAGVSSADVQRGDTVVTSDVWFATTALRADVRLLTTSDPLEARTSLRLHIGTRDIAARVVALGGRVAPGSVVSARIALDEPVIARAGDRFVIRRASPAATIGGGVVTDVVPQRKRARPFGAPGLDEASRLAAIVDDGGVRGVLESQLQIRLGLSAERVAAAVDANEMIARVGALVVARSTLDRLRHDAVSWLTEYHRQHREQAGAALEEFRARMLTARAVADHVVARLVADQAAAVDGATIRLFGWRAVDDKTRALRDAVLERLTTAGVAAPAVAELERMIERPSAQIMQALKQLERDQLAVALTVDRYAASTALEFLLSAVRKLDPNTSYRPSELRAVFGVSRQYLIPWLEYFDRRGYSRREGDGRRFVAASR